MKKTVPQEMSSAELQDLAEKLRVAWYGSITGPENTMGQAQTDEFDDCVKALEALGLASFKSGLGKYYMLDKVTKSPAMMAGGMNREIIFHDLQFARLVKVSLGQKHDMHRLIILQLVE